LAATGVLTAAAQPSLEEALSRIRHHVEVFETQFPDFVCVRAEYSDYRKYGASSTTRYPNLEPH